MQGRFLIWQVIGSKLPEALWLGQGSLEALYMPLQAEWFREHSVSAYANVAGNNVYAFNEFLRILFETGIAGFVLFVLLIFTGCRHSFRGNQKSRDAGSVFLAILSFGFFQLPFFNRFDYNYRCCCFGCNCRKCIVSGPCKKGEMENRVQICCRPVPSFLTGLYLF